ncbi:37721_t:CDS:1, partial [Gigaspora margarita]
TKINIIANPNIIWPKVINSRSLPLEQILQHHSKYKTFKQQLHYKQILYLKQLCSADNQTLLSWKHLSPSLQHLPTGKQLLWFTFLEETITENNIYYSILSNYQPQDINAFAYYTCHISLKPQSWFLTYLNQNIIIGKACRYFKHSNTISITHWSTNIDTSQSQLYLLSPISCIPCLDCNLNTN